MARRTTLLTAVVAALARGYNDAVDSNQRQELYVRASRAVGSRSRPDVEAARAELLHAAALSVERSSRMVRRLGAVWRALREPPRHDVERDHVAAVLTRELADRRDRHELAQRLFDALLAPRPAPARTSITPTALGPRVAVFR